MHNNTQSSMIFDRKFVADSVRTFLKCPSCRFDFSSNYQIDPGVIGSQIRGNRPVLLPCGHSMCENCIQQNYKNLVCADCSRPLPVPKHLWGNFKFRHMFQLNFFLMGTMKHLIYYRSDGLCDTSILQDNDNNAIHSNKIQKQIQTLLKCGECVEAAAVGKCVQCTVNFCKSCFEKVHMNSRVLKAHSLSALKPASPKRFNKPRAKVCNRHRMTCDRYCKKCQNIYCRNCIKANHANHGYSSLLERNTIYMENISTVLETVKQYRDGVKKAQREIKSVESELQDYAIQTLDDIAHCFWEMHGLLQLEFQKIVHNFSESCAKPQIQMRNAYDMLGENFNVLNKMRLCLESFQEAPSNIDLSTVVQNVSKQLNSIQTEVKISRIVKNPFVFQKLGDFKRDLQNFFSYKYEEPDFSLCVGSVYGERKMYAVGSGSRDLSMLHNFAPIANEALEKTIDMEHDTIEDISTILDDIIQIPKKSTAPDFSTTLANISYIKSPTYFFLQNCESLPRIMEISKKYEHVEDDDLVPTVIVIDNIYMGYYEPSKQWHRIIVLNAIDNDLFQICLVDIGAEMEMKRKNIRKLEQKYAEIAFAAFPCALYNIEPIGNSWTIEARDMMLDITRGKPVRVYIFGKANNGVQSVDLFSTNSEESISIRDAFLYMGLAREKSGCSQLSSDVLKIHPVAPLTLQLMKYNLHCGATFPVKVTHIENPTEFFIVRADHEEIKLKLSKDLNWFYNNKDPLCREVLYFAALKTCCAVRFKDIWYRGSVEEIEGNGLVRVRFVDEGRTEILKWNNLFQLEPKYRTHKEFAIRCSLYELEPLQKNSYAWSTEAIQEFKMLTCNPHVDLRVEQITQNVCAVTLYIPRPTHDINIGAVLVRNGHAISTGSSTQSYEIPKKSVASSLNSQKNELLETLANSNQQKNIETIERVPIKIVHIVSPGEFYVYLTSLEEGVGQFHIQLQVSQRKTESNDNSNSLNNVDNLNNWSVGDHCLVHTVYQSSVQPLPKSNLLDQQAEWFRAIIVNITSTNIDDCENPSYKVFLRDRGLTMDGIMCKQLRPISHSWDCVANSVQRCHLACLNPTGDTNTWPMSATDCFKQNVLTFNTLLATKQGEPNAETHSVPIYLWGMTSVPTDALAPSVSKYSNINRVLLNMGLAQKSERLIINDKVDMVMDMMVDSNQISLDEWYKNLDAIDHIAVIDTNQYDVIIEEEEEKNIGADNNEDVLIDVDTSPTWDEKAPEAWLIPKPINKTLFTAIPSYVNHSAVIFLHEPSEVNLLKSMSTKMMEAYKNIPPDNTILYSIGQPCIVQYHFDGLYYRGIVVSADNRVEEYDVQFVDYGNEETVKHHELRPFAPFRNLNSLARKYRVDGIRPVGGAKEYPLAALDVMHKILVDKLVSVRVQQLDNNKNIKRCSIRVGSEDFKDLLVREGRAEYKLHGKKSLRKSKNNVFNTALPYISGFSENINNENIAVHCMDLGNGDALGAQSELGADLETINQCVDNFLEFNLNNPDDKDDKDEEDDQSTDSNELSFDLDELKQRSPQPPQSTFKTSDFKEGIVGPTTYNLHQMEEKDCYENKTAQDFYCINLLENIDRDVVLLEESFISNYWKESSAVDIDDTNDKDNDESELALQWNHIKALQRAKSESSCDFDNFVPPDNSTSLSHFADLELFKWPQLPSNVRSFRCNVNAVVSPTVLYIFPHLKDFHDRDKEIKCLIKQLVKSAKPLANFTTNTLCLACYSHDDNWYRAIIRSYDADALEADVLFVDYWNTENVSIKNLKECPLQLLSFPLRTLKVQLYKIKPSLRMRERDVCHALKNELKQYDDLFVQVKKHPGEMSSGNKPVHVNIFDSKNASHTIYYKLIMEKFYSLIQ